MNPTNNSTTLLGNDSSLSPYCLGWIEDFVKDAKALGHGVLLIEREDTIVENLYQALPSGDYGRGDVRAAFLDAREHFSVL